MNTCDFCFEPTRNRKRSPRGNLECIRCRESREYYESLTPEQRRAEEESIARYVTESDGL